MLIFHIFCDDIGIHFVSNDVFWIIHIPRVVNVIHDAFDVLHPGFHLDAGCGRFQHVKHAVRRALGVCAAAHASLFFATRALFSICTLGMAPVVNGDRVFDAFAFHEVVLREFQFIC